MTSAFGLLGLTALLDNPSDAYRKVRTPAAIIDMPHYLIMRLRVKRAEFYRVKMRHDCREGSEHCA